MPREPGGSAYTEPPEIAVNPIMTNAADIERLIQQGLPDAQVEVHGDDGVHFEAVIVSAAFAGKSPVQQHQMVYRALGASMQDSVIHALSFKTLTPEQAAATPR